jgi:hypothetical protein
MSKLILQKSNTIINPYMKLLLNMARINDNRTSTYAKINSLARSSLYNTLDHELWNENNI